MQVTLQKSGNRSFKTLESSLKEEGEFERSVQSKKVSDTDEHVSMLLGVSPAILDSVIFCHQDESLWPMSEPAALKKKFDEIFEAQKYTKAIDQLKVVRKKQGEQLRSLQMQLKQEEQNKNAAMENQAKMRELTAEIERCGQEEKDLQHQIDEANQKMKEKREEANQFLSIMSDLENLQNHYKFRQDAVAELRDSIDMMPEDDEELKKASEQYESRLERLQGVIDEDTSQHCNLENEVSETRVKVNASLGEKGKLESDKEKYDRQLQTRVEMIQEAAAKHGIHGFNNELNDDQVRAFNAKIQGLLTSKKREHDKLQNELARTADEANAKISELEGKKSSLTSERTFTKQKRTENDRKIKRLQTDVDSLDYDEGNVTILETNKAALDERYQKVQDEFKENGWDEKIKGARNQLGELEKTSEDLNLELVNCTRLSSERAQLDLRKKELKERERNFESLVGTFSGRIASLLNHDWNIESLGSDYKAVFNEKIGTVNKAKEKCDVLQKDLDQYDFELAEARKRQANMSENNRKHEASVTNVLKKVAEKPDAVTINYYEEEFEALEESKLTAEKDLTLFDELKNYWEKAQTHLNTKNKCYMCDRSFDDDRSKSKILKKIAKQLDDETKDELEEDVRSANENLGRLRAVRSDYDGFLRLKEELPKIKKAIEETQEKRDEKLLQLEAAASKHEKEAEALREVESVSKSVSEITQLYTDIQESKEQIGRLHSQSQLNGTGRSADEIQNAQAINSEKIREVKKGLDNLTRERQRNLDLISSLELERSESKNKITQAKQQIERKTTLSKDIKGLRDDNQNQDQMVSKIDEDLKALQPQIDAARGQRNATLERGREKTKLVAEERDNVAHTLNKLKMIEDDIQDYIDQDKASSLASVERTIQNLQQQHERLKDEMHDLMVRINSQKAELAQGDRRRKNINDNLRYREHCRTLDSVSEKIEQLKAHNAEEDYNNLMREAKYYADEVSLQTGQMHKLAGRVGAMELELKDKFESHNTFYQGAEEKYKETKMKVETKKLAIDDLSTYSNAVDKAIMQFHSLKMEEVNRIAGELWRATYQGTDIDTIAIRSENETPTSNTNNNRRSYNYRVTMVKQNTEMDMRGRCSAGQKVLASIIIRLALAESFGVNCGLIALDEPTTNLDRDNIRSLAVSLHGIIKARQAQANFQLIVITHDEDFLRHMRCNEFCEKFYRVKRNVNQCSVIIKDDVSRITE